MLDAKIFVSHRLPKLLSLIEDTPQAVAHLRLRSGPLHLRLGIEREDHRSFQGGGISLRFFDQRLDNSTFLLKEGEE